MDSKFQLPPLLACQFRLIHKPNGPFGRPGGGFPGCPWPHVNRESAERQIYAPGKFTFFAKTPPPRHRLIDRRCGRIMARAENPSFSGPDRFPLHLPGYLSRLGQVGSSASARHPSAILKNPVVKRAFSQSTRKPLNPKPIFPTVTLQSISANLLALKMTANKALAAFPALRWSRPIERSAFR